LVGTTPNLNLSPHSDAYLDNIMANIPELALCLESKGFVRGCRLLATSAIPRADVSSPTDKTLPKPLFEPADVELNAAMLMRFLQALRPLPTPPYA
jgi:hypothetical protein